MGHGQRPYLKMDIIGSCLQFFFFITSSGDQMLRNHDTQRDKEVTSVSTVPANVHDADC